MSEKIVALILAGGVGTRLGVLCMVRAKPAVPFGGIYRIIDFTLSNLMNSDIRRVGVLTQYSPLSLTTHIRDGASWDFSGWRRGINVLPPYTGGSGSDWYRGTADAVYQNRKFLKRFSPENVLVVSGDHIYSMDYNKMIEFHLANNADATIGTMEVPQNETNRFGIMDIDKTGRIKKFYEKPEHAPSNLASLGIYIFRYGALLDYLSADYANSGRIEHDFGKHIIPRLVDNGKAFAYQFKGYWQDVGTVQSYWRSSMEFILNNSAFFRKGQELRTNLRESGRGDLPCAKIFSGAHINNSLISRGCLVEGRVENSILSPGVRVEKGAHVIQSVIMHDTVIRKSAELYGVICDKEVSIGENAVIGNKSLAVQSEHSLEELLDNQQLITIGKGAVVPQGTVIGQQCTIYPMVKERDFPGKIIHDKAEIRTSGFPGR